MTVSEPQETPAKLVPPAKHKVRHRKVKQGETIYKGHPSWNMMLNIKLGVSYSVGRIASEGNRELAHRDFKTVFKQEFPPEGSPLTPGAAPHTLKRLSHAMKTCTNTSDSGRFAARARAQVTRPSSSNSRTTRRSPSATCASTLAWTRRSTWSRSAASIRCVS